MVVVSYIIRNWYILCIQQRVIIYISIFYTELLKFSDLLLLYLFNDTYYNCLCKHLIFSINNIFEKLGYRHPQKS